MIPPIEKIERVVAEGGVRWVLIVEKDVSQLTNSHDQAEIKAVFQTLLSLKLLDQVNHPGGVLITVSFLPQKES